MGQKIGHHWDKCNLGVCYYPEHWDKSLWASDLDRMKEAGILTIRVGEFSWNLIEPAEGQFTFDFWDEFLALCLEKRMKVIFGTPTATPPAWLTHSYPEVLNSSRDGIPFAHGARRHYNYNSKKYQELSCIITRKLAKRYGAHPSIIGWQLDNEFNCEVDEFYSESDTYAFREFLQRKYGTLTNLNQAWGTNFWSQTYTAWEQITVPGHTAHNTTNPHVKLDYIRFISESAIHFASLQAEILRAYVRPGVYITTNGMFGNLDNHRLQNEVLDVYTYDSYPDFAYALDADPAKDPYLKDRSKVNNLAMVRSICPHFGIMEQQSGANGWASRLAASSPKPGQMKLWVMQSIAAGADFVSFFRWRTAPYGTEIYWHGILDWDNRDNRKLAEVKDIYKRIRKLKNLPSMDTKAAFALVKDYDNEWDEKADLYHQTIDWHSEPEIFCASELTHTPMDYLRLTKDTTLEDLCKYPVLIYPHASILTEDRVKLLEYYVAQGGTLILGCRTGYKDIHGHCVMMPQPGLLKDLAGATVRDFTWVRPADENAQISWNSKSYPAPLFNDVLEAEKGTKVLAAFKNMYYEDAPAITEHAFGTGRCIYVGSCFDRALVTELLAYTGIQTPYKNVITLPKECQLAVRENDTTAYYFVLNYMAEPMTVTLHAPLADVDTEETVIGPVTLAPYETKVYRAEK